MDDWVLLHPSAYHPSQTVQFFCLNLFPVGQHGTKLHITKDKLKPKWTHKNLVLCTCYFLHVKLIAHLYIISSFMLPIIFYTIGTTTAFDTKRYIYCFNLFHPEHAYSAKPKIIQHGAYTQAKPIKEEKHYRGVRFVEFFYIFKHLILSLKIISPPVILLVMLNSAACSKLAAANTLYIL